MSNEKVSAEDVALAKKLAIEGRSMTEIALQLKVNRATVSRYLSNPKKKAPPQAAIQAEAETKLARLAAMQANELGPIQTHVYDAPQRLLLIDEVLSRAQAMIPICKDAIQLRILAEAIVAMLNVRRTETLLQAGGPSHERPFELTIKVNKGDSVSIEDQKREEDDDLPELVEGQLVQDIKNEPDPYEPQGQQPDDSLKDFLGPQ